jgi:hypothetical protein
VYEYSRAIYRALAADVAPPADAGVDAARRRVLSAIEHVVERLEEDPVCTSKPARLLFREIRFAFPLRHHARVWNVVEAGVGAARDEALRRCTRRCDADGRVIECLATTRQGTRCQREPVGDEEYCPSHRHLARTEHETALVAA